MIDKCCQNRSLVQGRLTLTPEGRTGLRPDYAACKNSPIGVEPTAQAPGNASCLSMYTLKRREVGAPGDGSGNGEGADYGRWVINYTAR